MPRTASTWSFVLIAMLIALLALAGCAAPASSNGAAAGSPPSTATPAAPPGKVMSSPYPPREAKPAVAVDYTCRSNADCAVKDVGNCCGAMPACVNKDSPTDSQAVQAQCAARGMAGVCGFVDVSACQCVSGRCEADNSPRKLPAQ